MWLRLFFGVACTNFFSRRFKPLGREIGYQQKILRVERISTVGLESLRKKKVFVEEGGTEVCGPYAGIGLKGGATCETFFVDSPPAKTLDVFCCHFGGREMHPQPGTGPDFRRGGEGVSTCLLRVPTS